MSGGLNLNPVPKDKDRLEKYKMPYKNTKLPVDKRQSVIIILLIFI